MAATPNATELKSLTNGNVTKFRLLFATRLVRNGMDHLAQDGKLTTENANVKFASGIANAQKAISEVNGAGELSETEIEELRKAMAEYVANKDGNCTVEKYDASLAKVRASGTSDSQTAKKPSASVPSVLAPSAFPSSFSELADKLNAQVSAETTIQGKIDALQAQIAELEKSAAVLRSGKDVTAKLAKMAAMFALLDETDEDDMAAIEFNAPRFEAAKGKYAAWHAEQFPVEPADSQDGAQEEAADSQGAQDGEKTELAKAA